MNQHSNAIFSAAGRITPWQSFHSYAQFGILLFSPLHGGHDHHPFRKNFPFLEFHEKKCM